MSSALAPQGQRAVFICHACFALSMPVIEVLFTLLAPSERAVVSPLPCLGSCSLRFFLSSLSVRLTCTSGCCGGLETELGRWEARAACPGRGQSGFSLPLSRFPFLFQLWVRPGTRLTPPLLGPCSLVYVPSTYDPNCHLLSQPENHHMLNPVAFICFTHVLG